MGGRYGGTMPRKRGKRKPKSPGAFLETVGRTTIDLLDRATRPKPRPQGSGGNPVLPGLQDQFQAPVPAPGKKGVHPGPHPRPGKTLGGDPLG